MDILCNFRFGMLPNKNPPQAECYFKARVTPINSEIELSGLACTLGDEFCCTIFEGDVITLMYNKPNFDIPFGIITIGYKICPRFVINARGERSAMIVNCGRMKLYLPNGTSPQSTTNLIRYPHERTSHKILKTLVLSHIRFPSYAHILSCTHNNKYLHEQDVS